MTSDTEVCPRCEGTKLYNLNACSLCNGTGFMSEAVKMTGIMSDADRERVISIQQTIPNRTTHEWVE